MTTNHSYDDICDLVRNHSLHLEHIIAESERVKHSRSDVITDICGLSFKFLSKLMNVDKGGIFDDWLSTAETCPHVDLGAGCPLRKKLLAKKETLKKILDEKINGKLA